MSSSSQPDMTENDLHEHEEEGIRSANQISIFARLLNIGISMLDTLEFFLAPRDMLKHIDGDFDPQHYSNHEELNRHDDRNSAT
jgi:hypothetical protein